jgi:cytochrome c oxidase assembly factor CtaG
VTALAHLLAHLTLYAVAAVWLVVGLAMVVSDRQEERR